MAWTIEQKRAWGREYAKRPEQLAKSKVRTRQRRAEAVAWINSVKSASGCIRCGERTPICLGFHHRDPSTKEFEVAMRKTASKEKLSAEMAKCDVLCANCHLKEHERLRNSL